VAEIVFETRAGRIVLPIAELAGLSDQATVLDAVRHAGLPLGQSCRGEGVCRSCVIEILAGADGLTAPSPLERRFGFVDARRLACQAGLPAPGAAGSVTVACPGWGRPTPAADPAAPAGSPGPAPGATVDP